MSSQDGDRQGEDDSKATKRTRWATQRVKSVGRASNKRGSIIRRFQKNSAAEEKKRASGGTDSTNDSPLGVIAESDEPRPEDPTADFTARKIFFNQELPPELKDDNGHPATVFARNKIRTSKYTPLTFVPMNLWYQFHNIANIYFLFLIILTVSSPC